MNLETCGLISNFFGAFILAYSSNVQGNVTTGIINGIVENYGTYGMDKIPSDTIANLRRKKKLSTILNCVGYLLFIGGFGLQFFGKKV